VNSSPSECLCFLWALLSSVCFFMLSVNPLCCVVLLPSSAILTNLTLFISHVLNTTVSLFAVKPFCNLSLPLSVQPHLGYYVPGGTHTMMVLHHDHKKKIIWTTGKRHQRSIDSCYHRTRGKWCRKTNTSFSSQAWWARSNRSLGNCQNRIRTPTQITDKLTAEIYAHKLDLITTCQTSDIPDTWKTDYDKRRMQNAEISVLDELWGNWPLSHNNS